MKRVTCFFFVFIRHYKGLDLLLEAFNTEGVRKLNIKLLVAGEFYDDEVFYRNLIATQNLDKQVIVKSDFIPSEEVRYYFGAADLVVQPYRTATQSGISQVAYHFEKPMIVTNVGRFARNCCHMAKRVMSLNRPLNQLLMPWLIFLKTTAATVLQNMLLKIKNDSLGKP